MKYIKTFEGLNTDDIQIGDYVYGEEDKNEESKLLKDFTKNNICKVIDKDEKCSQICVVFDTVPHKKIQSRFNIIKNKYSRWLSVPSNIIEFAPTIEELEIKLTVKNYNL